MSSTAKARLIVHCGARYVSWEAVTRVETPPSTGSWYPVSHERLVDRAVNLLENAGIRVLQTRFALAKDGGDMFAAMELDSPVGDGVRLALVLRNTHRRRFAIGAAVGSWVSACDIWALDGEVRVDRRHTEFGMDRWEEALSQALGRLHRYQTVIAGRIARLQREPMSDGEASDFLFRCAERGILSGRTILPARQEWIEPTWEEYCAERNKWRAYNAVTTVLRNLAERNPLDHARRTIMLGALLSDPNESIVGLN